MGKKATFSTPALSTAAWVSRRIFSERAFPAIQYTKTIGFLPRYVARSMDGGCPGASFKFANFAAGNAAPYSTGGTCARPAGAPDGAAGFGAACPNRTPVVAIVSAARTAVRRA